VSAQVVRYAAAAAVAFLLLLGVLLLVRPLIYSVAPPRDDSVYAVATLTNVPASGPLVEELLLNTAHGLLGERRSGQHAVITVAISRGLTGLFSVVNAWSPVNDCALTGRPDRLIDCRGRAWTLVGDPFTSGDPPLQSFPVTNQNGALVVDFTHPVDAQPRAT
jgi:hypothetical protein